ncbi:MAG: nitrate reductase molybdenum cofactor assembly chaperone [Devosiaceae bacterium]|nr:nitrate reductase molybdenum cofactor assembly chaperone [Devosiaceae bacterium]
MSVTLKILSAILSYPSNDLIEGEAELLEALKGDESVSEQAKSLVGELISDICSHDVYDAQERYVLLFDRTRTNSLHLFEHVHGESRDRGQAMVDLAVMYEKQGFDIEAKELPDFIPVFLEYLSTQSSEEVNNLLGQTLHIMVAIRQRLQKRKSIYTNAFLAIEDMVEAKPDMALVEQILAEEEADPNDLDALDKIWEDEAVTFGAGKGEDVCGPDRLRTQIRAHNRPPPSNFAPDNGASNTTAQPTQINGEH